VFLMRYELGFYIPEYGILHGHRRKNLKTLMPLESFAAIAYHLTRPRY
jgi:hypothetical protein